MKKGRFTEHQIVSALKKNEAGLSIKAKYGGMESSDVSKLRDLEKEHAELKKMFAEISMENRAMKNLIEKKF
jgi:putative transposase